MKNPKNWVPPANPPELEWARLAAFIDGEGSIGIRTSRRNHCISVVVSNTDARLLVWAKNTFHVGTISIRNFRNPGEDQKYRHNKIGYAWEVQARAAQWLLEGCFPFFIIKQDQAQICLEVRATVNSHPGRKPVSLDVLKMRTDLKQKLSQVKQGCVTMEDINHVMA